jgi:hypothetical protein
MRTRGATAVLLLWLAVSPLRAAASAGPRFGSAIAVDPSGYFLTDAAVVEGTGVATLDLGGETLPAVVRGVDGESGLALLSVDRAGFPMARLGAYHADEKKQSVYVIGVPAPPAPAGAVVLLARVVPDPDEEKAFLLKYLEPPPPGMAGGAVVNAIGQVIGLAGPDPSGPFTGTKDLWDMARRVPDLAPSIPGTPMEFGEGAEGVRRLYAGSVARVRFEPGAGKPAPGRPKPSAAPPRPGEFAMGAPSDGFDLLQVDDGRVLRCRVGAADPKTGALPVEIAGRSLVVPKARVARVLYFRDYDPAPRNDDEKGKIARGLARWKGAWIAKPRADEERLAAEEAVRARLADEGRSWEDRRIVETEHFRIESNLSAARVETFGKLLQEYRRHLIHFLPPGSLYRKVPVYIFRDREDFSVFAARDVGRVSEFTVGYFARKGYTEVHLALFDMPGGEAETLRVLLHEATHLFFHVANSFEVDEAYFPMWLNEGLAEYHGGAAFRGGTFREGTVQDERLLWLQDMIARDRFIPLAELTLGGRNPRFGLDHYAQSWGFVHFLMHGRNSAYRGGFKNYVISGLTPYRDTNFDFADSLLRLLKRDDFVKVTEEFKEYVRGLKFTGGVAYAKRAADRVERKEDGKAVEADLQAALAAGPRDPDTLKAVARTMALLPGREAEAADVLRRSLEVDPLDAEARRMLVPLLPEGERAAQAGLAKALAD